MKRFLALTLLIFTSLTITFAQDIITLNSGQEVKARILKLNPQNVTFVPENSNDTISVLRNEISMLHYRSGTLVYLSDNENRISVQTSGGVEQDSLFLLGEKDASKYYKGYKGAATGTLITSFFVPLGLIPAIACSSTPPDDSKLGFRDQKLMESPDYYAGYTNKAFKIKKKKVWTNFAIGTGASIAYLIIVSVIVAATVVY